MSLPWSKFTLILNNPESHSSKLGYFLVKTKNNDCSHSTKLLFVLRFLSFLCYHSSPCLSSICKYTFWVSVNWQKSFQSWGVVRVSHHITSSPCFVLQLLFYYPWACCKVSGAKISALFQHLEPNSLSTFIHAPRKMFKNLPSEPEEDLLFLPCFALTFLTFNSPTWNI